MVELVRKGRVSDGLEEAAPAAILPVEGSELYPFNGALDDLKLRLGADGLFESASGRTVTRLAHDSPIFHELFYHVLVFKGRASRFGWRKRSCEGPQGC